MKNFTTFPCRANDAVFTVSSYRSGEVSGWLVHPRTDGPQKIHSLSQLIMTLDSLLVREEEPISYHAFEPSECGADECIATLRIQVLFREHYTWQGSLLWEEQQKMATFRSVLELIELMDEILAE